MLLDWKYRKIPVIGSGPIQLCKGFWVGLYEAGGGLTNRIKKLFQDEMIRNKLRPTRKFTTATKKNKRNNDYMES